MELIEEAFDIDDWKTRCVPAVVYLPDLDVGEGHLYFVILVYLPNLDVGEGHETLDINWEWGAYQVRLDDYFQGTKRENNKQH